MMPARRKKWCRVQPARERVTFSAPTHRKKRQSWHLSIYRWAKKRGLFCVKSVGEPDFVNPMMPRELKCNYCNRIIGSKGSTSIACTACGHGQLQLRCPKNHCDICGNPIYDNVSRPPTRITCGSCVQKSPHLEPPTFPVALGGGRAKSLATGILGRNSAITEEGHAPPAHCWHCLECGHINAPADKGCICCFHKKTDF